MYKEEEGRLRKQLTIAEVSDGVGSDSEHGVTALRVGETPEICAILIDSHLSGKLRTV